MKINILYQSIKQMYNLLILNK